MSTVHAPAPGQTADVTAGTGLEADLGDAPLLRDLVAGPQLSDGDQRQLVREAQDGTSAAVLIELDLLEGGARHLAQDRVERGTRARRLLLEACLGPVVDLAREVCAGIPPERFIEVGLEQVAAAIGRYDPDAAGPAFTVWAMTRARESMARLPSAAADAGSNGVVTAARARAALTEQPLGPQEVRILALRFGDRYRRGLSLEETGAQMEMSRYEVRVAESRAIARLRRHPSARQ